MRGNMRAQEMATTEWLNMEIKVMFNSFGLAGFSVVLIPGLRPGLIRVQALRA